MQPLSGLEPHPFLQLIPQELLDKMPERYRNDYIEARRDLLIAEKLDPFAYGCELPIWRKADQVRAELRSQFPKGVIYEVNLGGNRSSKSERAAKRVVQAMIEKPGSRWWCADHTEKASRGNQQRLIEKYLPLSLKPRESGKLQKERSKVTRVNYSVAGGFTENILVLPNGSECEFKFYQQEMGTLQAVELDGFWGDELLPYDWIQEITYRLVNRDGVFHLTFTPAQGYTQTVGFFLENSRILEETEAELLPIFNESGERVGEEKVPRVVQCSDPKARVIYFHTKDNPFGNYEGMVEEQKHKPRQETRMRVYGVVDKTSGAQFPRFKESVHVISLNRFREIEKQNPQGQRFMLVDPCSGRNWFMGWFFCPAPDSWIAYREWPSFGHPLAYIQGVGMTGPWAKFGEAADGDKGEAQFSFGFGLDRYQEEILQKEGGEEIVERWMDCRYGNSPTLEREGTTTLIEQMSLLGMDFRAMTGEKSILFAKDGSIDMINSALYFDEACELGAFSAELGRVNVPQLLITETCPNMIWALRNWTGEDGQHGACKDPIDIFRGLFLSQIGHIGKDFYTWKR